MEFRIRHIPTVGICLEKKYSCGFGFITEILDGLSAVEKDPEVPERVKQEYRGRLCEAFPGPEIVE